MASIIYRKDVMAIGAIKDGFTRRAIILGSTILIKGRRSLKLKGYTPMLVVDSLRETGEFDTSKAQKDCPITWEAKQCQ